MVSGEWLYSCGLRLFSMLGSTLTILAILTAITKVLSHTDPSCLTTHHSPLTTHHSLFHLDNPRGRFIIRRSQIESFFPFSVVAK